MANRVTPLTPIETLSGNISAQTYFDNNISPAFTALNDASLGYNNYIATDAGSANNYVVTCQLGAPSAYNAGMRVTFRPANTNTGPSTITVSPLLSVSLLKPDGTACVGGEIVAGVNIDVIYNGSAFQIIALPWVPKFMSFGTVTVSQSFDCSNASSVSIQLAFTAAITLTLTNLYGGVPVTLFLQNASGSNRNFGLVASNAAGAPYTTGYTFSGTLISPWTGVAFTANTARVWSGNSYSTGPALVGGLT